MEEDRPPAPAPPDIPDLAPSSASTRQTHHPNTAGSSQASETTSLTSRRSSTTHAPENRLKGASSGRCKRRQKRTSSVLARPVLTALTLAILACLSIFLFAAPASASVIPAAPLVDRNEPLSTAFAARERSQHDDHAAHTFATLNTRGDIDNSNTERLSREELIALLSHHLNKRSGHDDVHHTHTYAKREDLSQGQTAGYAVLVPVLVILSGIFAGLTLGYMSLDETQLQVLATTGTEKQRAYALKIIPVRRDGHLLLTTLLIANMITNETLPIISDPLFPSPVLAVVVSTILVIIFAELVPQSICSRYGLEIGAHMAVPTRIVMIALWPIAFPVSRVLHWTLGPHHGIVYRRAELKELVTMHAASGGRGGDLKGDTVMMVGGALDLQEKVVSQAMTPFDKVFMLPFDARLDYPTLQRIVRSGHSRIPIYRETEVQVDAPLSGAATPSKRSAKILNALTRRNTSGVSKQLGHNSPSVDAANEKDGIDHPSGAASPKPVGLQPGGALTTVKRKNIIGTLLVKSCVLLDPEDAVPVSDMTINALPTVPADEPLHNVLNAFQEGRSHMAIVTSLSRLDPGLDNSSLMLIKPQNNVYKSVDGPPMALSRGLTGIDEEAQLETGPRSTTSSGDAATQVSHSDGDEGSNPNKLRRFWRKHFSQEQTLEQSAPSDAELPEATFAGDEKASGSPRGEILGIITLEDVLEELIGEEIYDEYDPHDGNDVSAWNNVTPPLSPQDAFENTDNPAAASKVRHESGDDVTPLPPAAIQDSKTSSPQPSAPAKTLLGRLGLTGRNRGGSGSPVPSATEGGAPPSSPNPVRTSPEALEAEDGNALHGGTDVEKRDYFAARPMQQDQGEGVQRIAAGQSRLRQGSGHETSDNALLNPVLAAANVSRPTTPGAGAQANRPIVLRKTTASGGTQNVIVGENMLRGRHLAPGVPVVSVPQARGPGGGDSAEQLDRGALRTVGSAAVRSSSSKASRFKSTPMAQGAVGYATASPAVKSRSQSRSGSADPATTGRAGETVAPASAASGPPQSDATAGEAAEEHAATQPGTEGKSEHESTAHSGPPPASGAA